MDNIAFLRTSEETDDIDCTEVDILNLTEEMIVDDAPGPLAVIGAWIGLAVIASVIIALIVAGLRL